MEWRQAGPGGMDETVPTLSEGIGKVTPEAGPNQTEVWRPKPEALGVPELEPIADGLLEREGCRLADARR